MDQQSIVLCVVALIIIWFVFGPKIRDEIEDECTDRACDRFCGMLNPSNKKACKSVCVKDIDKGLWSLIKMK